MKRSVFSSAWFLLLSTIVFGQYGSSGSVNPIGMSMSKTYNASSNGVYALGINPANLMFTPDKYFEFTTALPLPTLGINTGTNFISLNDINYFFGGVDGHARYLTEDDKDRINNIFQDGGQVFGTLSLNILSAMYKYSPEVGAFAFSISDFAGGRFTIPKSIVELGMEGNKINRLYDFKDAEMKVSWMRTYSLTYSRGIPELEETVFDKEIQNLSAGISFKLVKGFSYASLERANTYFTTETANEVVGKSDLLILSAMSPDFGMEYNFDPATKDLQKEINPFLTPVGSGFGVDIGLAASMSDKWKFSFALTDIGAMTWNRETVKYSAFGNILLTDITDHKQIDSVEDKIKAKGSYIGNFYSSLPATLRAGVSYLFNNEQDDIPGILTVAFDYNQGFNNVPGNSTTPRFSVGGEWLPLKWLNVRTGISVGGYETFNWAFGVGFNTGLLELNIATTDVASVATPNSARKLSFSMGSRWKF